MALLSLSKNSVPWRRGIETGIFSLYEEVPYTDSSFMGSVGEPYRAHEGTSSVAEVSWDWEECDFGVFYNWI